LCLSKIFELSDGFNKLHLHEFAIVVWHIGSFWTRQVDSDLDRRLLEVCREVLLNNKDYEAKYSQENYMNSIGKIYEALLNLTSGDNSLKSLYEERFEQFLPKASTDLMAFIMWCMAIDNNQKGCLGLYERFIRGQE
jgi:hypothetical protein